MKCCARICTLLGQGIASPSLGNLDAVSKLIVGDRLIGPIEAALLECLSLTSHDVAI